MTQFTILIKNEMTRIGRDNLLIMLGIYPLIIGLVGRFGVPYLQLFLLNKGFDLTPHYPIIVVFMILMNPYIYGALAAFTILDEQEDHVLEAIRITPISMATYLTAKVSMIVVVSIITGVAIVPMVNLIQIDTVKLILINVLMALAAPFNMLLINSIANNKIEGFAVVKGTGFIFILPLLSFYTPSTYSFLFGIAPGYWPAYGMATAIDPKYGQLPFWMYSTIGLIYVAILCKVLYHKFERKLV